MKRIFIVFWSFFLIGAVSAQTTVNSLSALRPYLNDSNVNVKLSPGIYTVTAEDVSSGSIGRDLSVDGSRERFVLFAIEGNNSKYDFTDCTINIETDAFSEVGKEFVQFHILGNSNTLSNLTLADVGDTVTPRGALNLMMDGRNNLIEGFEVTILGSTPHGYGDIFGKGGGPVIRHSKHAPLLIRGDNNTVKNSVFHHKAYGHGIFMQGAHNTLIENCRIEGQLRTVNEVLAEEGTGSPADEVDFRTVWGYNLREVGDYRFSLQEDGIRAYTNGPSIIDGQYIERRDTGKITVKDSTVINMRTGIVVGLAKGGDPHVVDNCTVLGCEVGYWIGDDGTVTNSRGDASVGPLITDDITRSNANIEVTLLDNHVSKINNRPSFLLSGRTNNITIHDGTTSYNDEIVIQVGGTLTGHRWLAGSNEEPPNREARGLTINNLTPYPMVLTENSNNTRFQTLGSYVDNGANNSVFSSFTPNPNRRYYIDVPAHSLRLAANGSSDTPYTVSGDTTGADVEWKFVAQGNGAWHIQRASGGALSRLASDNSSEADMEPEDSAGAFTYYDMLSSTETEGTYYITLRDGPSNYQRLQVDGDGDVNFVSTNSDREWESFSIKEAPSSVVAHWDFDEGNGTVARDITGNGHDGIIENASWTTRAGGGSALSFNGSSSKVILPASAFESLDQEMTITFWAYGDSSLPNRTSIFHAKDSDDNRVVNVHLPWSDGQVFFDAGNAGYDRLNQEATSSDYQGSWVHWAFSKNATTGDMVIYRNGSVWLSGTNNTIALSGITEAFIGSAGNVNFYSGLIDEVCLYDFTLGSEEIQDLVSVRVPVYSPLEDWRNTFFNTYQSIDQAGNSSDPDGDGVSNLLEYATGSDPTTAGAEPLSFENNTDGLLEVSFSRINDSSLTYELESSSDLKANSWESIWTGQGTAVDTITVSRDDWPSEVSQSPRSFFRLKVNQ